MLNKILFLGNRTTKTSYIVCRNIAEADMEDTLVITDNREIAVFYSKQDYAVLYVAFGDEYVPGIKYLCTELSECDDDYFNYVFSRQKKLPLKVLETKRAYIREMTVEDLPILYDLYDDEEVAKFVEPLYEYEEEKAFTEKYIENMYGFYDYGLWLAFDKESDELIGRVGISIRNINGNDENELGYIIHRKYREKGLAKELCNAIINYARKSLGIDELFIVTRSDNSVSIELAKSLGFDFWDATTMEDKEYKIFVKST